MSKNTIIREGQVGRSFGGVAKLETDLTGGGTCFWVPKDERELEPLDAERNGTFRPRKYGFSRANVRVSGESVTGKGQDGNDYTVTVDDGDLVKTKIPSAIHITTEPTKTAYADGETINFSGLVVKAYDGEGNLYDVTGYAGGVVPNAELQFPVVMAEYDAQHAVDPGYYPPDGETFPGIPDIFPIRPSQYATWYSSSSRTYWDATAPTGCVSAAFDSKNSVQTSNVIMLCAAETDVGPLIIRDLNTSNSYATSMTRVTHRGKTFWWTYDTRWHNVGDRGENGGVRNTIDEPLSGSDLLELAYILLYGKVVGGTSTQDVPVNWPRPGDGRILGATFAISVSPPSATGGNTSGGGGEDEGGGGGGHSF